jgi:hypothetical protein
VNATAAQPRNLAAPNQEAVVIRFECGQARLQERLELIPRGRFSRSRIVAGLRGRGGVPMSTDEIMVLTRGEDG